MLAAAAAAVNDYGYVQLISSLFLVNSLFILSADDIKTLKVSTVHLSLIMLAGAVSAVASGISAMIARLIVFALLFIILFLLARRKKAGLGTGDAKVLSSLALYMNLTQLFDTVFLALTFGLVFGIVLMIIRKAKKDTALPFFPFILAGTIAGMFC